MRKEETISMLIDKYVSDVSVGVKGELYAIFDIIHREYKDSGKCLICETGKFNYNYARIAILNNHFSIVNDPIELLFKINYCPVCGGKKDGI